MSEKTREWWREVFEETRGRVGGRPGGRVYIPPDETAESWYVRPWVTHAVSAVLDGVLDPAFAEDATAFDVARERFRLRKRFAKEVGRVWSRAELRYTYRGMVNVWRAFHIGEEWMREAA
jgi:hypothetical protein